MPQVFMPDATAASVGSSVSPKFFPRETGSGMSLRPMRRKHAELIARGRLLGTSDREACVLTPESRSVKSERRGVLDTDNRGALRARFRQVYKSQFEESSVDL